MVSSSNNSVNISLNSSMGPAAGSDKLIKGYVPQYLLLEREKGTER
jgi:hypothetical protein